MHSVQEMYYVKGEPNEDASWAQLIGNECKIDTAPFHSIGMESNIDTAPFHSIGMECKTDRSGLQKKTQQFLTQ